MNRTFGNFTYLDLHFGTSNLFKKLNFFSRSSHTSKLTNSSPIDGKPSNMSTTNERYGGNHLTFVVVQASLTLCLNAFLICVIVSRKALRRKTSFKFFLNILAINLVMSVDSLISAYRFSNSHVIITNSFIIAMFLGLMVTASDRVMAIKHPFSYLDITSRKVFSIIACTWMPSVIFVCSAFLAGISQYHCTVISTAMIALSSVVLTISNIILYIMAKKHTNFVKKNGSRHSGAPERKTLKATYVCIAIVTSFVIFWLPYLIHNLLALSKVYLPDSAKVFTISVEQIAFLNSVSDPILFIWLRPVVRREMMKVLKKSNHVS